MNKISKSSIIFISVICISMIVGVIGFIGMMNERDDKISDLEKRVSILERNENTTIHQLTSWVTDYEVPIIASDGSLNYLCFNGYKSYNTDFHKIYPQAVDGVVPCDNTHDFEMWKDHPINCNALDMKLSANGTYSYLVNGKWVHLKC